MTHPPDPNVPELEARIAALTAALRQIDEAYSTEGIPTDVPYPPASWWTALFYKCQRIAQEALRHAE